MSQCLVTSEDEGARGVHLIISTALQRPIRTKYPPLSITRYFFIHLSELEQRRVKSCASLI